MKLWQKIALISLLVVVLSVSAAALFVSQSYFDIMIRREKDSASSRHEYIATGIANQVTFERMRSSELLLSESRINDLIGTLAANMSGADTGIAVYGKDAVIIAQVPEVLKASSEFTDKVKNDGKAYLTVSKVNDAVYLIVGSTVILEGSPYYLFTTNDITTIYHNHETALDFIRIASVIFAVISALLLSALVYILLRPLSTVNASIRRIAGGRYEERAAEKGGAEFTELSHNVNMMAQSIEENVEELQDIADSRKRFIDDLAHEMKTPLTSIVCLADVLRIKKQISDKERTECADIIVEEAKRLKNLSGKLLELTVARSAELDLRDVNVREILSSVETAFTPIFERGFLYLEIHPTDAVIKADRELFLSLLYNLIDNARKASSIGGTVEVVCKKNNAVLSIAVIDHGVGIPESELKRISEPFYMVDKSRSRKAGGAGLGLSLCMEIAKQHNAELTIESEPGKGTAVTVTVPLGGDDVA